MAGRELNARQQAFVREFLVDLNASAAYRRAGYSAKNANVDGPKLLANPRIAAAVQEAMSARAERLELSQDDVVRGLMAVAFFDIREVAEWGREPDPYADDAAQDRTRAFFRLRASTQLADDVTLALSEVRVDANGQLMIRSSDRLKALELLGRHLGMFKRDVDVNVRGGLTLSQLGALLDGDDDGAGDAEP